MSETELGAGCFQSVRRLGVCLVSPTSVFLLFLLGGQANVMRLVPIHSPFQTGSFLDLGCGMCIHSLTIAQSRSHEFIYGAI